MAIFACLGELEELLQVCLLKCAVHCDIFLAVGSSVLREWMELMLCPVCHFESLTWLSPFWQSSCTQAVIPSYLPLLSSKEGHVLLFSLPLKKSHYKWCAVSEKSALPLTRTQQPLVCCGGLTLWLREEGTEREGSKIYNFSHLSATSSPVWKPMLVFKLSNNSFIPGTSFMYWVSIDFFFLPSFPSIMVWLICF